MLAGVLALPPVRDRFAAAAAVAEAVGRPVPRPFARDVTRREVVVGSSPADLYDPGGRAPGLLLVPGAAPAGRDDERVVRLARALARSGLTVLVPELDLYDHRFTEADLDRLAKAVGWLHGRTPDRPVTALGFSLGGSLALVTAADPRARDQVGAVATFGAYADIVGYLQAATTGVSVVDGQRYAWDPPPQAAAVLELLALELTPPEQRPQLREVFRGTASATDLPPAARAAHALVTVADPDDVRRLVAALPPATRQRLERFSPAAVVDQVRADVLALHSADDPAVPYAELRRMAAAFRGARIYSVESFRHVDLQLNSGVGSVLRDLWTTARFAGDLMAAAR